MNKTMGPPSLVDTFSEAARTTAEFWAFQLARPLLMLATKDGRGQPVLVLPGLGGGDMTTAVLRHFLRDKGYTPYSWNNGVNTGPNPQTLEHLRGRLDEVHHLHDGQKVALIGHSLGGIYARELARAFPDKVAQVITLGSPFGAGQHTDSMAPMVRKIFELLNGRDNSFLHNDAMARQSLTPPPVPTTSIYTRNDGVVNWRTCINPRGKKVENIEVYASHCGLITNPVTALVIADRLAQDLSHGARGWKPFEQLHYNPILFRGQQAHYDYEPEIEEKPGDKKRPAPPLFK